MKTAAAGAPLAAARMHERLDREPLAATYFFYGDEPLQLLECADALRARALREGIAERRVFDAETGVDWQGVLDESSAMSLFSSRRLFEIRLGERKPDKAGGEVLERLAARAGDEDIVLVTAGKPDAAARKSKWFKALEQHAQCVASRSLDADSLPAWLDRRAARFGKRLSRAACELVADRVEGNMLAAAQEVEKLCLLVDGESIGEADVLHAVRDSARFDVFQLVDAMIAGELSRALRILRGLRDEGTEPVLINWALGRELRQLAQMAGAVVKGTSVDAVIDQYHVWGIRKPAVKRALKRLRKDELLALLAYANFIDTVIKGARMGEPWDEYEILIMNASGATACDALLRNHQTG